MSVPDIKNMGLLATYTNNVVTHMVQCTGSCYLQVFFLLGQTNMFLSDYTTDSPFYCRLTQFSLLCDSKYFLLGIIYRKQSKSDHFEVMRFLRQNLSKISAKMENVLIFEDKSHSRDNTKVLHHCFAYRLRFFLFEDHI